MNDDVKYFFDDEDTTIDEAIKVKKYLRNMSFKFHFEVSNINPILFFYVQRTVSDDDDDMFYYQNT